MKKLIVQFILLLGLFFWSNESKIFAQGNVANPISNLNNVTWGYGNTLIGDEAGKNTTSGYMNTFIGLEAGKNTLRPLQPILMALHQCLARR